MTTKKLVNEHLIKLWKDLNSDTSKAVKTEVLVEISSIIHNKLPFETEIRNITVSSCDMVINEFKSKLETNPNYKDTLIPSNLLFFTMAVVNSSLPE
jgi:hypothetical protein